MQEMTLRGRMCGLTPEEKEVSRYVEGNKYIRQRGEKAGSKKGLGNKSAKEQWER